LPYHIASGIEYWVYPGEDHRVFHTLKWKSLEAYVSDRNSKLLKHLAHLKQIYRQEPAKAQKYREQIQQFQGWRKRMARRTFTIEVKLDIDDKTEGNQAYEAMLMITKQYARNILASAVLVNDGRKQPAIALFTEDSFHAQSEIELLDPSDNVVSPDDLDPTT
jgi:hypothetical protein